MKRLYRQSALASAKGNLHHTTGVSGSHDLSAGIFYIAHFAFQQLPGHLLISNVVGTGAATAPIGLFQVYQLQTGDTLEQRARLALDFLTVRQMAGVMIC